MSNINSYKDLIVWQKSIDLVKEIYSLTSKFPESEKFGLSSQMRRCAISIPSNIAEAFGRRSIKSSSQFYSIAYGSALELETQLVISKKLDIVSQSEARGSESLLLEILKMLNKLTNSFKHLSTSP